ncbi:hypothetical protein [Pedobacter sp. Leaf194]|uniref:hypothetical protein n=1 Tax=Pedobacter sp. Leaf194 TaxID=1736297 RepID=UPI000703B897|nr:hypothetical protein [Pedobacter sp. Leaf194]KQS36951.1 hypothetical protein ASG14_07935 [Pedobacter sp. Leaf194]
MSRILTTCLLICFAFLGYSQGIFKKEANWMDTKNGITYEMNIYSKPVKSNSSTLAKVKFTIVGDVSLLEKIELLQENKLKFNMELKAENTDIKLQPGVYKFKIYHKKLGEKDFEVELKNAQTNNIKLTIK